MLAACSGSADRTNQAAFRTRQVPQVMPTFERVELRALDTLPVLGSPTGIAVTSGGTIAMLDPDGPDDPVLLLIDAATGSVCRVIRRGHGPGEHSGAGQVFASGSDFAILDLARMVLLTVGPDGVVRDQREAPVHDAMIVVAGPDSLDVIPVDRPGARGVFRRAIRDGGERVIVSPDDPFFAAMREGPARRGIPAFAARDGEFLVGDGLGYGLAVYDARGRALLTFGRDLPPRLPTPSEIEMREATLSGSGGTRDMIRSELETYAATPLPYFEHPGAWLDAEGRVRVVGSSGDSTFVDVFADSTHLGRVILGCSDFRRRVAQADQWLVLLCAGANDGADQVQVWRVAGGM